MAISAMPQYAPVPARSAFFRLKALGPGEAVPGWAAFLHDQDLHALVSDASACNPTFGKTPSCDAGSVEGHVWSLSQKPKGCRLVQDAIDACPTDHGRECLAKELKSHVWDAVRCPHANFVVQKLFVSVRPQACQFVLDEILQHGPWAPAHIARHKYGCRIMQRMFEHCRSEQLREIAASLLKEMQSLARHPYANYVAQMLVEHGTAAQRSQACQQLEQNAFLMGSDNCASAVVAKALAWSPEEDRCNLARALTAEPGLLASMARMRYGHVAVQLVLQILQGQDLSKALKELTERVSSLRASRYGRLVLGVMSGKI